MDGEMLLFFPTTAMCYMLPEWRTDQNKTSNKNAGRNSLPVNVIPLKAVSGLGCNWDESLA